MGAELLYWLQESAARRQSGDLEGALEALQELLQLQPHHAEAHFQSGQIYQLQGQIYRAEQAYRLCLSHHPEHVGAHYQLALCAEKWGDALQVTHHLQRALQSATHLPLRQVLRQNLCQHYQRLGLNEDARRLIPEGKAPLGALQRANLLPQVYMGSPHIAHERQQLTQALESFLQGPSQASPQALEQLAPEAWPVPSSQLIYQGECNRNLLATFAQSISVLTEPLRRRAQALRSSSRSGRPHLGFVITPGRYGIALRYLAPIINGLPRHKYRISLLADRAEWQQEIAPHLSHDDLKHVPLLEDLEHSVRHLAPLNFDLLYHWEVGSHPFNYLLPFLALAPVQCTSLGWPQSTGIPYIQHFLSSALLEGPKAAEQYSEKLERFANLPLLRTPPPPPRQVLNLAELGLGPQQNHYLCVQNLRKFHPDFDVILAEILQRDPQAQISYVVDSSPFVSERLRARFQAHMPSLSARIRPLPRMAYSDYLSLIQQVDVLLDTPHYGGANTTLEALALGTPVVTLPGKLQRSRYTQACYRIMQIQGPVAHNAADYAAQALRLGTDKRARAQLQQKILEHSERLFHTEVISEYNAFFERFF